MDDGDDLLVFFYSNHHRTTRIDRRNLRRGFHGRELWPSGAVTNNLALRLGLATAATSQAPADCLAYGESESACYFSL
jgi:hypothetical protein